jgi:membrane fusion protein (multidrug efflux system)
MQINDSIKRIVTLGALVAGLITSGCGSQQPPPKPPVPEVAIQTVQLERVVLNAELPGRTSAYLVAEVRPQVSGIIQKRLFDEGSNVRADDVLYQIDPAPFQAAYNNAKAALARAEANLPSVRLRAERYRELLPEKAVSQQEYDDVAAALKQAEAEIEYWKATVETARINLGYTRVTAPISGRIGKSNVTAGALVTALQPTPLATIQQLDPIYVDVPQATTELLRLRQRLEGGRLKTSGENQRKVKLILEDEIAYPLEGTLQFRDVTVDPATSSVTLRVIVPNPKGMLLPGMYVRALIQEGVADRAILVPQQGISRDLKGNPMVLIVDSQGKVEQRMITVDRAIGDKWLVSSGLKPGDQLIVEGIQKVRPGASVKAVPFDEGRKASPKAVKKVEPSEKAN